MRNHARSVRLRCEDWLEVGLRELGRSGPDALRIDALCKAAGKTRGSFYHHFEDHDAFRAEMLEHWRIRHTEHIIRKVEKHADPTAKRHVLRRLAAGLDQRVETAVRRLASIDADAKRAIEGVDKRRIEYLKQLNVVEFGMFDPDAVTLAEIEYATFVGFQMLQPNATSRKYKMVEWQLDRMIQAVARDGKSGGGPRD